MLRSVKFRSQTSTSFLPFTNTGDRRTVGLGVSREVPLSPEEHRFGRIGRTYLDYDADSEAEWDDDEDEPGEDGERDSPSDEEDNVMDEEGDPAFCNCSDGFLERDEELEAEDEGTKQLRKRNTEDCSEGRSASVARPKRWWLRLYLAEGCIRRMCSGTLSKERKVVLCQCWTPLAGRF